MIETSASGKIILFGEHAVVYGIPAIAVPVSSLRAYVKCSPSDKPFSITAVDLGNQVIEISQDNLKSDSPLHKSIDLILDYFNQKPPNVQITIKSNIPIASGLGSGAAVSAALGKALAEVLNKSIELEDLNRLVFEVEKIHHGTPSGIDNTVVVYERPVYYIKGEKLEYLDIVNPFHLVVADTGKTALTHEAVGDVRKLYEKNPDNIKRIFDQIGIIVNQAMTCMNTGESQQLGKLMTENHKHLQALTVSSVELNRLVAAALDAGALGAKLSGGGRGGNMIALAEESTLKEIKEALKQAGAKNVFDTLVK